MAENLERLLTQDQIKEIIRRRAARALPQLEILACFPQGNDSLFSLHLRDPSSQAELLLPVSGLWAQECELLGDFCRLDRAFDLAAKILDFKPPSVPEDD